MPKFTKIEDYQIKEDLTIPSFLVTYKSMLDAYEEKDIKDSLSFIDENKFVKLYRKEARAAVEKADKEYQDEIKQVKKDGATWKKAKEKSKDSSDQEDFTDLAEKEKTLKDSIIKAAGAFNTLIEKLEILTKEADWDDIVKADEDSRLKRSVRRSEWEDWRNEVVELLDIRDTTHSGHGSNFSGSQNLKQVIENLMEKVNKSKHNDCAKKLYIEFGYVLYG